TTPWISPCESWPPPADGPVPAVATGPGTLVTNPDVSSGVVSCAPATAPAVDDVLGHGLPRSGFPADPGTGATSPTSTAPLSSLAAGAAVADAAGACTTTICVAGLLNSTNAATPAKTIAAPMNAYAIGCVRRRRR